MMEPAPVLVAIREDNLARLESRRGTRRAVFGIATGC
jgi:hypothetical protein